MVKSSEETDWALVNDRGSGLVLHQPAVAIGFASRRSCAVELAQGCWLACSQGPLQAALCAPLVGCLGHQQALEQQPGSLLLQIHSVYGHLVYGQAALALGRGCASVQPMCAHCHHAVAGGCHESDQQSAMDCASEMVALSGHGA